MRPLLPFVLTTLLLLPAFGEGETWYSRGWPGQTMQQARLILSTWEHEAQGVEAEMQRLQLPPGKAPAAVKAPPEGDTTLVTCEDAMLFDAESNNIVYVGHVRLRDPRLSLNADGRLFIRLPKREVTEKEESAKQSLDKLSEENLHPRAKSRKKAPVRKPEQRAALPGNMEPIHLTAQDAVADTEANHLILFSPAGGADVVVESGANIITVTPAADQPAHILTDADGNVTIVGDRIFARWTDEQQRPAELRVEKGSLCYNAAEHAIALSGDSRLHHPSGDVHCSRDLFVRLQGNHRVPDNAAFLQQFAALSFTGLGGIHAEGGVEVSLAADGEGERSELCGEVLDYDAESGLCTLSGEQCSLVAAQQYSLQGAQRISLNPEGLLLIEGRKLSGAYSRPREGGGEPLTGTFRTSGPISLTPAEGHAELSLPQGIAAKDAEAAFSCKGAFRGALLPAEGADVPELPNSKLNLALLRFRTLDRASACGNVRAHRYDPATGERTGLLQAERAEFDLTNQSAELFGTHDKDIVVLYNGNRLRATPDGDNLPYLNISAAGDVDLRGGLITAALRDDKNGAITAKCSHALRILRAENRLETDGAAEFHAAEGVLVTNDSFGALLLADEEAAGQGGSLHLPYKGVREAFTDKGGSVRTTKGSMQCTGPIRVVLDPEAKDKGMGGLRTASAEGDVAVAGKDPNGRFIRARGDRLSLDAASGEKLLTGSTVTLEDANNTHTATGPGAAVRIDARNCATITGATHSTSVRHIHEQIEQQKKKD